MIPKPFQLLFLLLSALVSLSGGYAAEWQKGTCSGGGQWRNRLQIEVTKTDSQDAFLTLPIGVGENALSLEGSVEEIRLFAPSGKEILFELVSPEGKSLHQGPIQAGSQITIPIQANQTGLFSLYYGNRRAWRLAEWLPMTDEVKNAPFRGEFTLHAPEVDTRKIAVVEGFDLDRPEQFHPEAFGFSPHARFCVIEATHQGAEAELLLLLEKRPLLNRLGREDEFPLTALLPNGEKIPVRSWSDMYFIQTTLQQDTIHYIILVETEAAPGDPATSAPAKKSVATGGGMAFPGTMQQNEVESEINLDEQVFPSWIWERNILKNGALHWEGDTLPGWEMGGNAPFETHPIHDCEGVETIVTEENAPKWLGWKQTLPVEGGETYILIFQVRDFPQFQRTQLYYQQTREDGEWSVEELVATKPIKDTKIAESGATFITTAQDTANMILHLVSDMPGVFHYDTICLAHVTEAEVVGIYGGEYGVRQVPSVTKVFPETLFSGASSNPSQENPAQVFAARNESETLQLALRVPEAGQWRLCAEAPQNEAGKSLSEPKVEMVGYVPVNYPSNYYHYPSNVSPFIRRVPHESIASDGWEGIWPDPLIPFNPSGNQEEEGTASKASADQGTERPFCAGPGVDDFGCSYENDSAHLAAMGRRGILEMMPNLTRAIWLTFKTTAEDDPGIYCGTVRLTNIQSGEEISIPYRFSLCSAVLPDEPATGAIYDIRSVHQFQRSGESHSETQDRLIEFLAERKISSDMIPATPDIKYDRQTKTASCDWTHFDEVAHWYFDELHTRWSYTPRAFYLFGWGLPPMSIDNEAPYEGESPYENADHALLRPEYKEVFQAKLRLFWDHLKEKGWDRHFVLYISDEPFYYQPEILTQMQALCAMIHEVDPTIPIYSSTWDYVPEWNQSINIWGISHYGTVPPETLRKIREEGGTFWWTTDGQMCLDTPYAATERLLPWWSIRWGAGGYEFWGSTWYTIDPFNYGWHSYIPQSDTPTNHYFIRYPNGDGFLIYPGQMIGLDQIISSVRCESARDGQEDALLLTKLNQEIERLEGSEKTSERDLLLREARIIREEAYSLVPIPVSGGRHTSRFYHTPEAIDQIRTKLMAFLDKVE